MTREAVRVAPQTKFREIVARLNENGITAVPPVVDAENRPVGIVSEADLMQTQALRTIQVSCSAQELMTSPAVGTASDRSAQAW